MGSLKQTLAKIVNSRDELSPRNFRGNMWAAILAFPLSIIMGDLRFFDLHLKIMGLESYELMLFPLGLGWLVLVFLPERFIIPALKLAAIFCALILPFQLLMPEGMSRFIFFMAFQFLNGVCAGAAFSLFCFVLNNVERLFGMSLVQLYYGFYYTFWRTYPSVSFFGKNWSWIIVMAIFLATVLCCRNRETNEFADTPGGGSGSAVTLVLSLHIVYYLTMCMINYIEWAEKRVDSWAFGFGEFAAIALVIVLHLLINRSALYSWLLFLVLSLLGSGALLYNAPFTILSGSFAKGLGDGLGYIVVYYICGGVIKQRKSHKVFRLCCLMLFAEYFVISGILTKCYQLFIGQSHILDFGIVFILCCICFLLTPVLQRRLFEAPWTDGFYLADMPEYDSAFAEVEKVNSEKNLGLSPREREIFTLMLKNMPLKTIALELGISFYTVNNHYNSIYHKLGIHSKGELFMKYGEKIT